MFYAAYGSNMCAEQMQRRCPGAEAYASGSLGGYRLAFRGLSKRGGGVATLDASEDDVVPCRVYRITSEHLAALDRYEGYPRCYQRVTLPVQLPSGYAVDCIVYIKTGEPLAVPRYSYELRIRQAYEDHGFAWQPLEEAYRRSIRACTDQHLVFVYGSLMSGFGNHRLLGGRKPVPDTLTADLSMVSLGAFPALIEDEDASGDPIIGEVYEVDDATLADLDVLEGTATGFYKRISVFLDSGRAAYVYVLATPPSQRWYGQFVRVPRNDWRKFNDAQCALRALRRTTY